MTGILGNPLYILIAAILIIAIVGGVYIMSNNKVPNTATADVAGANNTNRCDSWPTVMLLEYTIQER